MKPAETLLDYLTKAIDRYSLALNTYPKDIKSVKILIRYKDGIIQEPEVSIDLKRD